MWTERLAALCRQEPSLVAVYESHQGNVALLLRHTLVPLSQERAVWLRESQAAAGAVVAGLRGGGFAGEIVVLQWQPLAHVARVLNRWVCRYDADPERRIELTRFVERYLADRTFIASQHRRALAIGPLTADLAFETYREIRCALAHTPLGGWYQDMAQCWLGTEPPLRRQLILQTHWWITKRALPPARRGGRVPVEELRPDGALASQLTEVFRSAEAGIWRSWVRLVLTDLRWALTGPFEKRDEAWARWLFLIPYSNPARGAHTAQGVGQADRRRRPRPSAAKRVPFAS